VRRLTPVGSRIDALAQNVQEFAPDLLLMESWVAFRCAQELRKRARVPLVYRSQNVEVDYWRAMSSSVRGYSRMRLSANTRRIAAFEREVRLSADLVLDISENDRLRSEVLGQMGNARVLPGTRLPVSLSEPTYHSRDVDVLFAGNLWAPNNVSGLLWFIRDVMPALLRRRPDIRVTFAGARPTSELREAAAQCGIAVIADPEDLQSLRSRARVLVNPQCAYGGLMQKMLDYFAHGAWIVSTTVGAAGLTGRLPSALMLEDEPDGFADAVIRCLERAPHDPLSAARYLNVEFGQERLARSLEEIAVALSIPRLNESSA